MAVKRANGINNDASGANGTDLNSLAQQELLNADRDFNPYRYENQSSEANPRVSWTSCSSFESLRCAAFRFTLATHRAPRLTCRYLYRCPECLMRLHHRIRSKDGCPGCRLVSTCRTCRTPSATGSQPNRHLTTQRSHTLLRPSTARRGSQCTFNPARLVQLAHLARRPHRALGASTSRQLGSERRGARVSAMRK